MISVPPQPPLPAEQRGAADVSLRYEDFCQDGRMLLPVVLQATGPALWGRLFGGRPPIRELRRQGIVPVLTRLVLQCGPDPSTPARPFAVSGGYELAHAARDGEAERLLMLMWGELGGTRDRLAGPPPEGVGEPALCGRFFAESTFTRIFAPPGQRKVRRFDVAGLPAVPALCHPTRPNEAVLALPDGAIALEPGLAPDVGPIVFGVCHTDSNQHVNSLAYPRLFEEAALRRFAALGVERPGLARAVELAFHRPCFAGDRVRVVLRAFALGEHHGALGAFFPEDELASGQTVKPHCYAQMLFER